MKAENFKIKKNGNVYRMNIPFGFDAKIEKGEVVLTKHWTILDAEGGDIIAYGEDNPALMCFRCAVAGRVYDYATYWDYPDEEEPNGRYQKFSYNEPGSIDNINGEFRPATEEERKRFFEEMDKAGYEWHKDHPSITPKGEEVMSVEVEEP